MKAIISMILKFNFFVILNPCFCFVLLISISVHGLLGTFFVSFELLIDFDFLHSLATIHTRNKQKQQ